MNQLQRTPTIQDHISTAGFLASQIEGELRSIESALERLGGGFRPPEAATSGGMTGAPKADYGMSGALAEEISRFEAINTRLSIARARLERLIESEDGLSEKTAMGTRVDARGSANREY